MSSVKDSRRRRHSRQPYSQSGKIHTHLSPPSALSLLSTSTSGSNSTVIPDRFLRSGLRPSKRQESKRPVTRTSVPTKDSQTESVGNHSDKENVTAVLSSNRWELKKTTIKEPVSKVSVTKEASPVKLARREPAQGEPAEAKPAPMEQASVAKVRIGSRAKKRANDHSDVFAFMVKDGQEVDSDAEKAEKEEEGEEQQKGAQGEEDGDEKEDEEGEEEEEEDDEDEDEAEGKVEDADESDEDDQQGNATNNVNIAPSTFSTSTHGSHPTLSSSCDFETGAPPKIEQQQHIWRRSEASLHSDSGISVRSSSPERESPAPRHRHPHVRKLNSYGGTVPNPSYPGYYPPAPMPPVAYVPRTPAYPRDWSTYGNPMENPEVYYASTRPVVTQTMQRPARLPPPDHQPRNHQLIRGPPHPQTEKPARQKKSGYDELAAAIDSRGDAFLKPIYRKFETLNHRILLYLQDEISETEEELRELDLAITLEEQMLGNTHASRRTEAKLPSQLQWRRLELLNRSYTKIEQYSTSLSLSLLFLSLVWLYDRWGQNLNFHPPPTRPGPLLLYQPHPKPRTGFQGRHQHLQILDIRKRPHRRARNNFFTQRARPDCRQPEAFVSVVVTVEKGIVFAAHGLVVWASQPRGNRNARFYRGVYTFVDDNCV